MARSLVRISVLFVLTILLAAPWSTAAPQQDRESSAPLLVQLWNQITAFLWGESGCGMDPGGVCKEGSPPSGCIMDPHGGCRESSAPTGDSGCGMDPHGGCGH